VAYKPGKATAEGVANPVKLSSNENILGCSPGRQGGLRRGGGQPAPYPDSRATRLRAAVAERYGLEPERLVFGDGTDECLHLLCQTFLEPGDNIVMGEYGFGAYAIGARACQAEVRTVREPDFVISAEAMLAASDDRTRLLFVTQPGNPTGTYLDAQALARSRQAAARGALLVLDGAYAEFADAPDFDGGFEWLGAATTSS
jgi:histidinol-phosphate aminotransferase